MKIILSIIISYLIGSIPTAYLFGRLYKGIDIREHGSGNVGATNAFRVLGKGPGIIVLFFDVFKGVLATTAVVNIFGLGDQVLFCVIMGLVAVAGHNWTVFLSFKGGKGIATSLGVLIGLTIQVPTIRPVLLVTLLVWGAIFLFSGYVSLASMTASTILPVSMVFTSQPLPVVILGIVLCVSVVFRHRPNIQRLLEGRESRVQLPFFKKH